MSSKRKASRAKAMSKRCKFCNGVMPVATTADGERIYGATGKKCRCDEPIPFRIAQGKVYELGDLFGGLLVGMAISGVISQGDKQAKYSKLLAASKKLIRETSELRNGQLSCTNEGMRAIVEFLEIVENFDESTIPSVSAKDIR